MPVITMLYRYRTTPAIVSPAAISIAVFDVRTDGVMNITIGRNTPNPSSIAAIVPVVDPDQSSGSTPRTA
jgi:hypothetical protein